MTDKKAPAKAAKPAPVYLTMTVVKTKDGRVIGSGGQVSPDDIDGFETLLAGGSIVQVGEEA